MAAARIDFDEDIARAGSCLELSRDLKVSSEPQRLYRDVRLSSVAMAVGAMDAYFCDKYVDCITRALRMYARGEWPGVFPQRYARVSLPAAEVLNASRTSRPHWGIRMAARQLMEKDNMYSVSRVPDSFNPILPDSAKLWQGLTEEFIALDRKRFTGISRVGYEGLTGDVQSKARAKATRHMVKRLGSTVQYRHDWIHNCGRPKDAIRELTAGQAKTRIREIEVFVKKIDDHIEANRIA